MKKILGLFLGVLAITTVIGCGKKEATLYTVSFDSKGGSEVADMTTREDGKISKPADPTKAFYDFDGWYLTESYSGSQVDFSTETFAKDTTLYAKWELVTDGMSYQQFMTADTGDNVVVEGYIQDRQSWWNNKATLYVSTGNAGEGYFVYEMPMTEKEYNEKYTVGAYVRFYGVKAEYAGEQEISDVDSALTTVVENVPAMRRHVTDVTNSLKTEDLLKVQNAYFTATLEVVEYTAAGADEHVSANKAYGFKGNQPDNDLYLKLKNDKNETLSACIESYLTGTDTDVYKTVLSADFVVGATVRVRGYMYWYNGANAHITSIEILPDEEYLIKQAKEYANFMSVPVGSEVTVHSALVMTSTWYQGKANLYFVNPDASGYYVYDYACTEAEFSEISESVGSGIYTITGTKSAFEGLMEITDATITLATDPGYTGPEEVLYINAPDEESAITAFEVDEGYQNYYFVATMKIAEYKTTDANAKVAESKAFGYKGDEPTDDLYFTLVDENGVTIDCCVERYDDFSKADSSYNEILETLQGLQVGSEVMVYGLMYWYKGPNPHIVIITDMK